jgi:Fe-S-cluster containining protein
LEAGEIKFGDKEGEIVLPLTEDMRCPFLDRKAFKCVIYENRPFICRVFVISSARGLQCYYMKPDGTKRGKKDREKRIKECEEQMNRIVGNINRGNEKLTKLMAQKQASKT